MKKLPSGSSSTHLLALALLGAVVMAVLCQGTQAYPNPNPRLFESNERPQYVRNQMLSKLRSLEAALLRQGARQMALREEALDAASGHDNDNEDSRAIADRDDDEDDGISRFGYTADGGSHMLENLRRLRRNFRKRNYNLDHLARMNFRRSFRASSFNNRHILGGL